MLPAGSTLGILGGGQLGRMLANEARRLGYRVAVVDPSPDCPARGAADHFVEGRLDDPDALRRLAEHSDVLTLETEHVPAERLEELEGLRPLRPGSHVLAVIQDRLRQRAFLEALGIPQPAWRPVGDADEAREAIEDLGAPAILKTRRGGYDGLGQVRIKEGDDPAEAFAKLDRPAVMERFIPFDREVSVLIARGRDGAVAAYPVARNDHRDGILHITRAPTHLDPETARHAQELAERIAEGLDHVGVLCVELFVVGTELLVNEVAPRVHNSGHYTLGGCITSQFEQHVRAVCGLPLGDTTLLRPAAMLNVLGDAWKDGHPPPWDEVLATPGTTLHLYGKRDARPGRKMGHVLVLDEDLDRAWETANRLHEHVMGARA